MPLKMGLDIRAKLASKLTPAELSSEAGAGTVPKLPTQKEIERRTPFNPYEQPAPRTQAFVQDKGEELAREAINAWENRVRGVPIVDIAHAMGVSIETARSLVREAHNTLSEDLKEALLINRELDLARLDQLIKCYLPHAREGHMESAAVVLKCIAQRAKLTGANQTEPPDPARVNPANVLIWIQNQLPTISKIVDSLPSE